MTVRAITAVAQRSIGGSDSLPTVMTVHGDIDPPSDAATSEPSPFRQRLLDGLAASIEEFGYARSKIDDIVRHARTSKRTFYEEFPSKEACYFALLTATNESMRSTIEAAVDPSMPWRNQVRQAIDAYFGTVESHPGLSLSWIRDLPAIETESRSVQRAAMDSLTQMLFQLGDAQGFRDAGIAPISRLTAILLLGGLRELTAAAIEHGDSIHDVAEIAIDACIALLGPRSV